MEENSSDYIKREQTISNIRFICCDNIHFMREIDMGYYHLGVVDPQYGIDADSMNMGTFANQRKYGTFRKNGVNWDAEIPSKEYFEQLKRITRNRVIWGGNYFLDYLPSTDCCFVWDKEQGDVTFADFELAWTSFECKSSILKRSRMKDVKHEKIHRTQKPVYLYKWIFSQAIRYGYLKKQDRVLDTHGGSHNIAIAAFEFGLKLTILEKEMEYHLSGIENFKRNTMQGALEL